MSETNADPNAPPAPGDTNAPAVAAAPAVAIPDSTDPQVHADFLTRLWATIKADEDKVRAEADAKIAEGRQTFGVAVAAVKTVGLDVVHDVESGVTRVAHWVAGIL